MPRCDHLPLPLLPGLPITALAPMQDITDLPFMAAIANYGSPDYFFTEYFRVYENSNLDKTILRSITENKTGRPIFAQLIGESIPDLVRAAKALAQYNIAGIDLNMGCPAPRVYRKNVGGGLLRDPQKVDCILGELRAAVEGLFSVKMRVGFADTANFATLLTLLNRHQIDLLSLHGRTVKDGYHSAVHYSLIGQAVQTVNCPVLANGNISSATTAKQVLETTGSIGVMVGRAAIRNPWIFRQIRDAFSGQSPFLPTLGDVRQYIEVLRCTTTSPTVAPQARVNALKKYLNFIGQGVDPAGAFLQEMRRTKTEAELFGICDRYLLAEPNATFPLEPYPGLIARPSCETEHP